MMLKNDSALCYSDPSADGGDSRSENQASARFLVVPMQ